MLEELIAPCGMNCALCSGYLALQYDVRKKGIRLSYCNGCRQRNKQCAFLKKKCDLLLNMKVKYCHECGHFPCTRLSHLDERYRNKYRMSMIENLETIRDEGLDKLLEKEEQKWLCTKCGSVLCCHNGICFNCGLDELQRRAKPYEWQD